MSLQKGQELKNQQKYKEAINELDTVVKREPNNQQAWQEKSFCENAAGLFQDSILSCERLLRLNSNCQVAWNNQAYALTKLDRIDEAIKCLDYCLKLNPNYEYAYNTKAYTMFQIDKYQEGLQFAERALQINPNFINALNNKGFALYNLGKYPEALQCFDRVLASDKIHPQAWCNKGNTLNMMGKHNEGLKCVEESLKHDINSANAWNGKGQILIKLKNIQEAILCFQKALQLEPKHKLARTNLSAIQTDSNFFNILSEQQQQQISKDFMERFLQDSSMLWVGKLASLHAANPTEISIYFKNLAPYIMRQYEVSELKVSEPKVQVTTSSLIHYGVYKKQQVAIKEVSIQDEHDPKLNQLLRESAILAYSQHDNIAIIKAVHFNQKQMDVQIIQEKYFMDLESAIFGKKPIKIQNKKQVALQILDALSYIHQIGLMHEDLKLSNIMFKTADLKDIVLLNFGTSKISPLTKTLPAIPQSYCYCPPEITEQEHIHASIKSDMFSFGIVLYELVSGKKAWYRYNAKPMQVYEFIQKKNFNFFVESYGSGVVQIDNFVKSCVQIDQNLRPTAQEAKGILEKIQF